MGGSDALGGGDRSPTRGGASSPAPEAAPAKNGLPVPSNGGGGGGGDLLDLEAIFGGGAPAAAPGAPGAVVGVPGAAGNGTVGAATGTASGGVDLLADVFGASAGLAPSTIGEAAPAPVAPVAATPAAPAAREDDFGGFEVAPSREEEMVVRGEWVVRAQALASFRLRGCGWFVKLSGVEI